MNTPAKHKLPNGAIEWHLQNGKLHREDGPAIIEPTGTKYWYTYDKLHRENGPAIEWASGAKRWYQYGLIHREDGPAVIYTNGDVEYWIEGNEYDPVTFLIKQYEYTNKT